MYVYPHAYQFLWFSKQTLNDGVTAFGGNPCLKNDIDTNRCVLLSQAQAKLAEVLLQP